MPRLPKPTPHGREFAIGDRMTRQQCDAAFDVAKVPQDSAAICQNAIAVIKDHRKVALSIKQFEEFWRAISEIDGWFWAEWKDDEELLDRFDHFIRDRLVISRRRSERS